MPFSARKMRTRRGFGARPPQQRPLFSPRGLTTLSLVLRNLGHFCRDSSPAPAAPQPRTAMTNAINQAHELASTAAAPQTQRRLATQHVREARDRLTSTSGTRPVFDYELLRQFAQNRISASPVILLLVVTIGLLSGLWTGALTS